MNPFADKMKSKSDEELNIIIKSKDYVIEAKVAAHDELNHRSEHGSRLKPLSVAPDKAPPRHKASDYHRKRLLFGSIGFILTSWYFALPTLLTFKVFLTELEGAPRSAGVFITPVSSKTSLGGNYKTQKATLVFHLYEVDNAFRIVENIGQDLEHEGYDKMAKKINEAENVTVLIKPSKSGDRWPQVFQIAVDDTVIYSMTDAKSKAWLIFIFLQLLGGFGLILYIRMENRPLYDRILRKILFKKPN